MSEAFGRRQLLQGIGLAIAGASLGVGAMATPGRNRQVEYGQDTLPPGIRSRRVDNNNGVLMHVLEAGFETPGRPCVVLLHGFPELAYTWRHQLPALAQAGVHAIAPDLRGYGRSAPQPVSFDDHLQPYALLNRVSDVLGLVRALGYEQVSCVIGHDWGGPTAAWCALVRPDVFRSVVLMSTPFGGSPALPLNTANAPAKPQAEIDIDAELAALPRPRKHYFRESATRAANESMWHAPQGVHALLRAMYHFKSADWEGNTTFALQEWTAAELARLPEYYVMDLDKDIAATMAQAMPSREQIAACRWMTEANLRVYSTEYARTGFQGGLNAYRIGVDPSWSAANRSFAGRTIDVPSCFIGGARDWGVYQTPGALEAMQKGACTRLQGVHLVAGAGHSLAEEQPQQVNRIVIDFMRENSAT